MSSTDDNTLPPPPPGTLPPPPGGALPPPPAGPTGNGARSERNWKKIGLLAGAVLVVLMIIGALTSPDETKEEVATTASVPVTKEPVTTMAPTTTRAMTTSTAASSTTAAPTTTTTRSLVTTTAASALPAGCVAVTGPVGDTIGGGEITGAAVAPPNPVGDQGPRWYYSTAAGATWVSSIPPDASSGGLTLPINDAARAASETGVDVPQDAPAYDGIGDAYPTAAKSRECAAP